MYALVDCNNFYASCERVFQPQFNGKPVAILSNNDGCVISRSEEAKAAGVQMGVPEFKIRELVKEKGVKIFSSNYPLYGDLSERVMKILATYTPNIEVYSIDEAFMNFDGVKVEDFHDYGLQIRSRLIKWVGLPTSIGFAPTKALSKVANKIAKKFEDRTKGVYVIDTDEKRIKALKWTKIEDVWGIGHRTAKKLKAKNINNALEFTSPHLEPWIKREMGVIGLRLKYELEGKSVLGLDIPEQKKSIAITRSFPKQISEFDLLRERVSTFATVCAEKLRKQNACCHSIIVMLVIDKHKDEQVKFHYFNKVQTLPFATNSDLTISNVAIQLLKKILDENPVQRYKKAGVIVSDLIPEDTKQFQLFDEENPKYLALMKTMDFLNKKNGMRVVKLATQNEKTWDMKQNHLSPRYTTNFKEILTINVDK